MWKRLRIILLLILFVAFALSVSSCFLSAAYATSPDNPETVTLTWSEYQTLNNNLTTLANNSTLQQQRIEKLNQLLQTASLSTNESQTALIKAQNQTQEQEKQLQKLNQLLETQTQQLNKAQTSLAIANESLTQLERDLRRERAATNRNRTIAIIAGATALYFATR